MNEGQKRYIENLNYEYLEKKHEETLRGCKFTENAKIKLSEINTANDLIEFIKKSKCFGIKDSLIIGILGD